MDVLESLNGMLIKGLGCGLRCKDQLRLQNVPLEMSVISAQTRHFCLPPDALCCMLATGWMVWTLQMQQLNSTWLEQHHRAAQDIMGTGWAKEICEYRNKG